MIFLFTSHIGGEIKISEKKHKSPLRIELCSVHSNFGMWTFFVPLKKSDYSFLFSLSQTNFDVLETHVFKEILPELSSSYKGQANLFVLIKSLSECLQKQKRLGDTCWHWKHTQQVLDPVHLTMYLKPHNMHEFIILLKHKHPFNTLESTSHHRPSLYLLNTNSIFLLSFIACFGRNMSRHWKLGNSEISDVFQGHLLSGYAG